MMKSMIYLGLGSNMEPRLQYIKECIDRISTYLEGMEVSSLYETDPRDMIDQPPFYNCVARGYTPLQPLEWLSIVKELESTAKRDRQSVPKGGPRTLDVDILLFGDDEIHTKDLIIPHERIEERQFVMVPMLQLDDSICLPGHSRSIREISDHLPDQGVVLLDLEI